MTDHMPGCAALQCEKCNHPVAYVCHSGGRYAVAKDGTYIDPHEEEPGPCDCELGTLRAEVERLKKYEQMTWSSTDIHTETVEVPKAEDLVKEITRLRDWQRRANECLDECRELAKEQGEWPLADEIGKLMAEAGQADVKD